MPIPADRALAKRRAILAALLAAALAACAPTAPPPLQPQRTYGHIAEPTRLYVALADILKGAGYGITKRDFSRREVETSWKERDGEARGAVVWRERRMYSARFEVGYAHDQYELRLKLAVQERPAGAADWTDKQVVPEQDAEYARILQELDQSVRKLGGVRY
jgi:hypothetical protein